MHTDDDQIIRFLPALPAEVARAAGIEAAIRLTEEWGGTKRYIPATPKPTSPVVQIIGMRGALALADRWGGAHHDIPRPSLTLTKLEILRHTGTSREAAQDCKCTERYVRLVRSEFFGDGQKRFPQFGGIASFRRLTDEQKLLIGTSNEGAESLARRYGCSVSSVESYRRLVRKQAEIEGSQLSEIVQLPDIPAPPDANAPLTEAVGTSCDTPPHRPRKDARHTG